MNIVAKGHGLLELEQGNVTVQVLSPVVSGVNVDLFQHGDLFNVPLIPVQTPTKKPRAVGPPVRTLSSLRKVTVCPQSLGGGMTTEPLHLPWQPAGSFLPVQCPQRALEPQRPADVDGHRPHVLFKESQFKATPTRTMFWCLEWVRTWPNGLSQWGC